MSQEQTTTDSKYWARYYAITGERPAWATVLRAIEPHYFHLVEVVARRVSPGGVRD